MAKRAIIVGVDAYPVGVPQLLSSSTDAYRIASWLITSRGFLAGDIALAISPGPTTMPLPAALAGVRTTLDGTATPLLPTANTIDMELADLESAVPLEEVFFYFAGHGASSANVAFADVDAICCADFTPTLSRNALSVESIKRVLMGLKADRRFLIIDACRDPLIKADRMIGSASGAPAPSRHAPGIRILHATANGDTAQAIANVGGVMTTAFIDAVVKGVGPAKQWDENTGDYVVRWQALKLAVNAQVGRRLPQQIVFANDDVPAGDDLEIVRIAKTTVAPVTLQIDMAPLPAPPDLRIRIKRNESADDDIIRNTPGPVALDQSNYTIVVDGAGATITPKSIPKLAVFDGSDPLIASFQWVANPPLVQPPAPEPTIPDPPAPDAGAAPLWMDTDITGAQATAAQPSGTLAINVDGAPIRFDDPLVAVMVTNAVGMSIDWDRTTVDAELPEGAYTVAVTGSSGTSQAETVYVTGDERTTVDLPKPFDPPPALTDAISVLPGGAGPLLMPSESIGPLSDLTMPALGALGVAQSVLGRDFANARALQLGDRWMTNHGTGIHLLIADERNPLIAAQRMRIWQMHRSRPPLVARTRQPLHGVRFAEAAVTAPPDGYWLELADADRSARAGFKAATAVIPGHVTLLVVLHEASGRNALFQFAIDRIGDPQSVLKSMIYGEAVQRGRRDGRPLNNDPALQSLINDEWYEPFSAIAAAFALYAGGDAFDEPFRTLTQRLTSRTQGLTDIDVAQGLCAELDGDLDAARHHYRTALDRYDVPISSAAATYLVDAAKRFDLDGDSRAYLREKIGQMVAHPLWTVRREDDRRRSGKPNI